jgi:hypothetical protein
MAEAPPSSHDGPIAVGRSAVLAGAAAATAATVLFRVLTAELTNDHFVHQSRGWQILQGEVPVRDFFGPGRILQYYTSTAALALSLPRQWSCTCSGRTSCGIRLHKASWSPRSCSGLGHSSIGAP